ncbi:hypothetical protein ACFRCI_23525 [Streptomyces sp. NPDC056638]|uniref:hypothetical protein n=1 Tax=Streptomyces sp. NPDC056638 TaxID=3345887 RepID=UPI003695F6BD
MIDDIRSLAFAPPEVFERAADCYEERYRHARDRTALLCVGFCRRHKPREDFRELPTHGRAARCKSCEGDTWRREAEDRTYWELEQAREKLRMHQRYAARLKAERYCPQRVVLGMGQPTSADAFRAHMRPWERVMEARRRKWAPLIEEALRKAHADSEEER